MGSLDLGRFQRWALESEGSTRTMGLLRLGLAIILWARFGAELAFFHHPNLPRVALICVFTPLVSAMLVGWWSRTTTFLSGCVVAAMWIYATTKPDRYPWSAHHVYLTATLLLLCSLGPVGKSYSVDRYLEIRRARREGRPDPEERSNLWVQRLITIQIGVVYFWAAAAKTNGGYFSGSAIEATFMNVYALARYPDWLPGFHLICVAASWGTMCIEYLLSFALFVPRLRPWCIALGVVFHGILYLTLPVETYSATMILAYLAFLDPDRVHHWLDDVQGHTSASEARISV